MVEHSSRVPQESPALPTFTHFSPCSTRDTAPQPRLGPLCCRRCTLPDCASHRSTRNTPDPKTQVGATKTIISTLKIRQVCGRSAATPTYPAEADLGIGIAGGEVLLWLGGRTHRSGAVALALFGTVGVQSAPLIGAFK